MHLFNETNESTFALSNPNRPEEKKVYSHFLPIKMTQP